MRATIQYLDKNGQPAELAMLSDTLLIGREQECELVLDDPGVSKRHAQIIRVENEYIIRDQGSVNGTYVGEHKITHHTLRDGDRIRIGKYELLFRAAPDGTASSGELATITAAHEGGDAAGLARVVEPAPFTQPGWIEEQIAAIGAREQAGRRAVAWIMNSAIIFGIALILIVLFAFGNSGSSASNLGMVTLEMGYPQVVYVPEKPEYTKIEVSPQGLLEVSLDNGDATVAELRTTDSNFNIIKVVPSTPGDGTIILRGQRDYVINVTVIPRQKEEEPYAAEYAAAKSNDTPDDVKQTKARLWLEEAKNVMHERPYTALEWADIADAYAGNELTDALKSDLVRILRIIDPNAYADNKMTDTLTLKDFHKEVKKEIDRQWQGLRLKYSQAVKQSDLNERATILKSMMALIPDKRDLRYQWAKINLERTNFTIAQQRRPIGPWGG